MRLFGRLSSKLTNVMAESFRTQKNEYRKHFKKVLNGLSVEDINSQSSIITKKVLDLEEYKVAQSISIFLSMPGKEISTTEIVLQAFRDGKKVFIPYLYVDKQSAGKRMCMLRLKDKQDFDTLHPDKWGIPSLSAESATTRENAFGGIGYSPDDPSEQASMLDLIFMPAMAFDQINNRLGHGKGFYDRYLSEYETHMSLLPHRRQMPRLIGLALKEQMLAEDEKLPVTEQDWKVDHVVVADG